MIMESALRAAVAVQTLRDLDLHFALYVARTSAVERDAVMLAAALVSRRTGEGDICISLDEWAELPVFAGGEFPGIVSPPLFEWRDTLRASGIVGRPGDFAPLVLDDRDRLYLGRYWHFEDLIVRSLRARAEAAADDIDIAATRGLLDRHFPRAGEVDHQRLAAAVALLRPFAVIAGGPGTGKTATVARLLALLVERQWPKVPRISLVAPTGKAAARLSESIKAQKRGLDCPVAIRDAIVEEAGTLHRLLKAIPGRAGFRHHAGNPLHADVVVVDEASMVDVPTMARLLDALPPTARLIILGDPDQLASVEAGSVLGDICNRGLPADYTSGMREMLQRLGTAFPPLQGKSGAIADSRVVLQHSRRFGADSGIGTLARAINAGNAEQVLTLLSTDAGDVTWHEPDQDAFALLLGERAIEAFTPYLKSRDPVTALALFNRFRFLCALREGPFGVQAVNRSVEQALRKQRLIGDSEGFYTGRPLMITRNDYALGLFNGDVGIVWPDEKGRQRAFFVQPDGSARHVLPTRLPEHETAFAMTIHKSQGSEFNRCVVVLPDRENPVLTRELVYTGVTRAREAVELWGPRQVLMGAIRRRVERASGLRDALWNSCHVPKPESNIE